MNCYRVTFQFTDDDRTERRTALVDAETGLDAMRETKRIYEGVGRIFRTERLDSSRSTSRTT